MITRRHFMERSALTLLALQVSDLSEGLGSGGGNRSRPGMLVSDAIKSRRTVRRFSERPLKVDQVMKLLWSAQGITDRTRGYRSVPSAGALYPLEVHAVTGRETVNSVDAGAYWYRPDPGKIERTVDSDLRSDLARASLGQMWMASAPVSLVISAVYTRSMRKYGQRGIQYTHIEAGCSAQNIFLMAGALGLSAGIVGAFNDAGVARLLGLEEDTSPLLIMPVGYAT
ncbi:SagB/ThcOx family dehydrogenase [bacterium]|nr:MAG: SagB/ThcOx family dehydrogenase [bacterium]